MIANLAVEGLLGHHVDHRTGGALPVQHRSRAAQYVDAVHGPGVHGKRDGASTHVQAVAVIQLHGRTVPGEATGRKRSATVARRADEGDAGGAGHCFLHRGVVASTDVLGADAGDAGWRFQGREVQARTAGARGVQVHGRVLLGSAGDGRGGQCQCKAVFGCLNRYGHAHTGHQARTQQRPLRGMKNTKAGHIFPFAAGMKESRREQRMGNAQAHAPTETGLRPPTAGLPNKASGRSPGSRGS